MRITDNRPTAEVRRANRTARSSASGAAFSLFVDEEPREASGAASAGGYAAVADVSVLLAVQSYDGRRQARRQEIDHGLATLDALDGLKLDLLSGRVSPMRLAQLGSLAYRQRAGLDEPGLDGVLSQIELRAKVELAKLEKQRG
jgi:hypothetical protein